MYIIVTIVNNCTVQLKSAKGVGFTYICICIHTHAHTCICMYVMINYTGEALSQCVYIKS